MSNAHLVVSAATQLFAERGFVGTSLRDLASHLSLAMGTVYRHFRTKDDLLAAIVLPYALAVTTVLRRHKDAEEGRIDTAELIRELVQLRMQHPSLAAIVSDPAVRNHATIGPIVSDLDANMVTSLAGADPSKDAESRATIVAAMVNSLGNTLAVPERAPARQRLERTICEAAAGTLRLNHP